MALPKLYEKITWVNDTTPALNEDNLNEMSQALDDIDDRVIDLAGTIMEDVPQIQEDLAILEPAIESIDENVARAEAAVTDAETERLKSEGFAVGEQNGVPVDSSSPYYHNNAKYYSQVAPPTAAAHVSYDNTESHLEATNVQDAVDEVSEVLDTSTTTKSVPYAPVITVDDASAVNAVDLKARVEAVQDLHGYTKPWVGGAGKNKFQVTATTSTVQGVTLTVNADKTVSCSNNTASGLIDKSLGSFTGLASVKLAGCPSGGSSTTYCLQFYDVTSSSYGQSDLGSGVSATLDASHTYEVHLVIRSGVNPNGLVFKPMVCLSTESNVDYAHFEPYTNICPITGHSEVNVTRAGKNLCESKITGNIGGDGGIWEDTTYALGIAKVKKGQTYVYTSDDTSTYVYAFYTDVPVLNSISYDGTRTVTTSGVFTAPIDGYIAFRMSPSYAYAQCEVGTQATSYEPYMGEVFTIDLDGTCYGGVLDVDAGTLTLTHKGVEYDGSEDESWEYFSVTQGNMFRIVEADRVSGELSRDAQGISNRFETVINSARTDNTLSGLYTNVDLVKNDISTVANLRTWLSSNPVQLVYKLATPQTITLTPTQIQLLLGYNTVFADTGDTSLTYIPNDSLGGIGAAIGSVANLLTTKAEIEITAYQDFPVTTFNANSSWTVELPNPSKRIPKAAFFLNSSGLADGLAPIFVFYSEAAGKLKFKLINVTDSNITTPSGAKVMFALLF